MFLTLDRVIEDRRSSNKSVSISKYLDFLLTSGFQELSGRRSIAKDLAGKHFIELYRACGGPDRFSDEQVKIHSNVLFPELEWYSANSVKPVIAVHPTNPSSLKAIPRACAMIAKYIGFETLELDDLDEFDVSKFIRNHTRNALEKLRAKNIKPTISAEELLRLMRDQ